MKAKHLQTLISAGETQSVEFKRQCSTPIKLAKAITAFANTSGGYLLIGVDDDGQIVGIDSAFETIDHLETARQFYADPPVEVRIEPTQINRKTIVVAEIPSSPRKPHYLVGSSGSPELPSESGLVYVRQGSKNLPISPDMIGILTQRDPLQPDLWEFDHLEQALLRYLQDHSQITLKQFCHLVNISERRANRILVKWVRAGILNLFQHEREPYYAMNGLPGDPIFNSKRTSTSEPR